LNYCKPGSVFLDIGANIGYYSLLASRSVGEKGRVIAFEPNPMTIKRIKKNIHLSGAVNIELFDIALSNKDDVVELFCPINETHGFTSMRNHGWENVDCYKVPTKKLDDILPTNLTRIDLIKIDVEGAEMLAFEGAVEVIKKFKPPILMELNEKASENFGYDTLEVVKLLLSLNKGYRLKYIGEHSIVSITLEKLFSESMRNGGLLLY
jgi:FkbM family methyltransferase